jgi:DNA-binding IscR family transcriptional regulator
MYSAQSQSFGSGTDNVEATGMNLNHANERIFSPVENSDIIKAVNGSGGGTAQAQPTSMGDVHLHVHAIDASGVAKFLGDNKHGIRDAVNQSYAENSGGGL